MSSDVRGPETGELTAEAVRELAREAATFFFPMVEMYKTMHAQGIDADGPHFKAPFNSVGHATGVFTPADTDFVTPNSDTQYSFAWLDLRAEPVVLTLPPVEPDRYLSVQVIDLHTHIAGYVGTRTTGNGGGHLLIVGPEADAVTPEGFAGVIGVESQLTFALFRTQLFDEEDMGTVRRIQSHFDVRTLSAFQAATYAAPSAAAPVHPDDADVLARLSRIGVGAGGSFDDAFLPPETAEALQAGISDARKDYLELAFGGLAAADLPSASLFGTREQLGGRYLHRYAGAAIGIFGNAPEEAVHLAELTDADGQPLDAGRFDYRLRLTEGTTPPALAFWSFTMYGARTKSLVDNPVRRYLISSRTVHRLRRDPDGARTVLVQRDSPGAGLEPNWLPAPDGPFYLVVCIFVQLPRVMAGGWNRPRLHRIPQHSPEPPSSTDHHQGATPR